MKIYLDSSYLQKTKHRRVFLQAADFFTTNEKLKGQLIIIVSPFAAEKAIAESTQTLTELLRGYF